MNANDIEELFCLLDHVIGGQRHRAALTALVAERHKLAADLRWKHEQYDMLSNSANMNAQRIRDLERQLEAQPSADRDRDRELRERLVDSALRGVGALSMLNEETAKFVGRQAVWMVDGAVAAMRKGDGYGK